MTRDSASDRQRYHFGEFVLDRAARELRRDRQLLAVPPRVFDVITYLVEHRDRAVGRDELISAIWGRIDVADRQVAQVIMRARQILGQHGEAEPQIIRTIYGFGYRWVADVAEGPSQVRATHDASSSHIGTSVRMLVSDPSSSVFGRLRWAALSAFLVALIAFAMAGRSDHSLPNPSFATDSARQVVVVLPFDVRPVDAAESAWIRLGIMDLVAERLRRSGLAVPPSDGVVSAVHTTSSLPQTDRLVQLARTLAADLLIEGAATRADGLWKVELRVGGGTAVPEPVEFAAADIVPAANGATDRLLAALGRSVPQSGERGEALSEVLQRAKAAMLAQQIDIARDVLVGAPEAMRKAPALLFDLSQVEYFGGRFRESEAISAALLDDPALEDDVRLRAKVLAMRGSAAMMPSGDWSIAMPWFDAAVKELDADATAWAPELADMLATRGLARAYLREFDTALLDLGRARALFESQGNRLGLGRVHNNFGTLELQRGHLLEALPHYRMSIEINESLGQVRRLTSSLSGLLEAQIRLLHWQDALATAERLRNLQDRLTNPVWEHAIGSQRATVLIALGRHDEAQRVLEELDAQDSSLTNICEGKARVRLAWQLGNFDATRFAALDVLRRWPSRSPQDEPLGDMALLLQRASMATGLSDEAAPASDESTSDTAYIVAQAEWASHRADDAVAENLFRRAMALAEDQALPSAVVLVADAYGRWLIERNRIAEATAVAGRVAGWADSDFDSALLQVAVMQAARQPGAWLAALKQAEKLAGQRDIPAALTRPPG